MKKSSLLLSVANFSATLLLIGIILSPFLVAHKMAKVAGIKTANSALISSQIERFPNLSFSQSGSNYKISFTKQAQTQTFLAVLILTNPTNQTKTYSIANIDGTANVFFGEDASVGAIKTSLPPQSSIPISIYSSSEEDSSFVEFSIEAI